MAAQLFTWRPRTESVVDVQFRTFSAQFGNGYQQTAGDGINNKTQGWSLTFLGSQARMMEITNFLDEHQGWKSFLWSPTIGPQALFLAGAYQASKIGPNLFNLTVTFRQTFQP